MQPCALFTYRKTVCIFYSVFCSMVQFEMTLVNVIEQQSVMCCIYLQVWRLHCDSERWSHSSSLSTAEAFNSVLSHANWTRSWALLAGLSPGLGPEVLDLVLSPANWTRSWVLQAWLGPGLGPESCKLNWSRCWHRTYHADRLMLMSNWNPVKMNQWLPGAIVWSSCRLIRPIPGLPQCLWSSNTKQWEWDSQLSGLLTLLADIKLCMLWIEIET